MIRDEVPITVIEGNDPLLAIHVDQETTAGVVSSYDFTAATEIKFVIKKGVAVADAQALASYTKTLAQVVVVGSPSAGNLTVQILAAALATPGVYRYRLDVTKAGKIETIMMGPFIIQNA